MHSKGRCYIEQDYGGRISRGRHARAAPGEQLPPPNHAVCLPAASCVLRAAGSKTMLTMTCWHARARTAGGLRQRAGLWRQAAVLVAAAIVGYAVCVYRAGPAASAVELVQRSHEQHLQHAMRVASKHGVHVAAGSKLEGEEDGGEAAAPAAPSDYVAEKGGASVWLASVVIFTCGAIGLGFAGFLFYTVSQVSLDSDSDGESAALVAAAKESDEELVEIYEIVREGAKSFLWAEYQICFAFIAVFGTLILVLTSRVSNASGEGEWKWNIGAITATSFLVGGLTSILSGYIGMMVAVYSNARTAVSAKKQGEAGWTSSFNCAFRAGGVMGYSLVAISMIILYCLALIYREIFSKFDGDVRSIDYKTLFECLAGYGLGGSAIAMFGRVGGGIFTKAADVGADLSGKVIGVGGQKLDEDSPFNPGVIADNVGDNVGDVAGMGADLFGSFAESTCAALVIAAQTEDLLN
ncbi:MAG: sodium/proton-translocating pyrophosphatase, partial [Promethearchaeia archaeon]